MTGTEGRVYPTEHQEQCALMEWARALEPQHPELALLYAIPNAVASKAQAGKRVAEGMKSGVPDLCLPVARKGFHGMYIEMKKVKGGRIAPCEAQEVMAL